MNARSLLCWCVAMGVLSVPWRADGAEGKLKGYMFGDYYYVASGADKKENGFLFRRIYLTYDLKWDDEFSGRLRLETKDAGFGKKDKMTPFVKHAYLRYKKDRHQVYIGLSGTPTWSVSEAVWGYRSIGKTIMDQNKIGSSADLGVALKSKLDQGGKANVTLMVGNGSGQGPEVDNGKKVYGQLHLKPAGGLQVALYGDWEGKPAGANRFTMAAFLGTKGESFHGGLEGFIRTNKKAAAGSDVKASGLSAFGAGKVSPKAKVFARLDYYDPSDLSDDDREYRIYVGLDLIPIKDVHIMPNVMAVAHQAAGVETETVPRLTFYYKF